MSAKKSTPRPKPVAASSAPVEAPATPAGSAPAAAMAATDPAPAWIDSPDPRRRLFGKIALVALWVYIAALWLLAIDQWFNLGIFGPKIPPLP